MTASRLVVPSGGPKMDGISESLLAGGAGFVSRLVDPATINYTVCTSGTHPANPAEGAQIYETDTDTVYIWDGSAWVYVTNLGAPLTYTPSLAQSATVTKSVVLAEYFRRGRQITGTFVLTCTSSGTVGNAVLIGMPVASSGQSNMVLGHIHVYDATLGYSHHGNIFTSTASIACFITNNATNWNVFGASPAITLVSGSVLTGSWNYTAAA